MVAGDYSANVVLRCVWRLAVPIRQTITCAEHDVAILGDQDDATEVVLGDLLVEKRICLCGKKLVL
jgi:hypothetical protein